VCPARVDLCFSSHSKSHHGLLGHPGGTTPRLLDQKEVTDLERISAGHFGDVFRAIFERFLAVIKIPRGGNFEAQREEFNMLLRITPHPHVLTLLGGIIDYERKQVWLVLAYKPGGSLADKVKRDPSWYVMSDAPHRGVGDFCVCVDWIACCCEEHVSLRRFADVLRTIAAVGDICDGLAHLHLLLISHGDCTCCSR